MPPRPPPFPARNARHGRGKRRRPLAAVRSSGLLAIKDGRPNRRLSWVGPLDTVSPMRRDLDPVAGAEKTRLGFVLEAQPPRAGQQQHPFDLLLVVPEARRARLDEGGTELDAQTRAGEQRLDYFRCAGIRQIAQEVHDRALASAP